MDKKLAPPLPSPTPPTHCYPQQGWAFSKSLPPSNLATSHHCPHFEEETEVQRLLLMEGQLCTRCLIMAPTTTVGSDWLLAEFYSCINGFREGSCLPKATQLSLRARSGIRRRPAESGFRVHGQCLCPLLRPFLGFHCFGALLWRLGDKESAFQCRRHGFNPWFGKLQWKRRWQSIPVFLA